MINTNRDYVQNMNIKYNSMELIDIPSLVNLCKDKWFNQSLCKVNESVVRLGILEGEYHWHKHDKNDEFFFILEGNLFIDIENNKTVDLKPFQGYVVPKGILHRTKAQIKTILLMIENVGINPLGDKQ